MSVRGYFVRCALAALSTVSTIACGSSPITSTRIESAVAATFANLVHVQVSSLGLPPMESSEFAVNAHCRRIAGNEAGSGDWVCSLLWLGPQGRPLRDTFDLFVATDGCYTATAEGDRLGGPTLKALDGSDVRNLLYTFEGCFDTT